MDAPPGCPPAQTNVAHASRSKQPVLTSQRSLEAQAPPSIAGGVQVPPPPSTPHPPSDEVVVTGWQLEGVPSHTAPACAGSQKYTWVGSQLWPTAGSFVQTCVTPSQYASNGQTALSAQAPPIGTAAAQTVDVPPTDASAQTRSLAHVPPRYSFGVQGWPSGAAAAQIPHAPIVVNEHRPLAHCDGVLQGPPLATVPGLTKQAAGIPPSPRNVVQSMPAYALPHCSACELVQEAPGAASASLQDTE